MRKLFAYLLIILFSLAPRGVYSQMPWDFVYHAAPVSITLDIPEEVTQVAGNLQSTVNQSQQIILQGKADISNLQSAATTTFDNIKSGAILEVDGVPGLSKSTYCNRDINYMTVRKMARDMRKALMTYKSKQVNDVNEKIEQRNSFYINNIYAIYVASKIMQQDVEKEIKASIELATSCAEGDGELCKYPSSNNGGNNEVLFTYGKTLEAYDSVVRIWESVAALKARLKAVQMMMKIEPQVLEDKTDTTSANYDRRGKSRDYAYLISQSFPLAFAQVSYNSVSGSLSDIEAASVMQNNESMRLVKQTVEFVAPEEADNEHPLVAAEDKLAALDGLSAAETDVTTAMNVHNMVRQVKEYRKAAEELIKMQDDYNESLQRLKLSEQCAIKYLGHYFSNPVTVWSGVSLGDNVNRHDLRKGISAWAIDAYDTAKAAETTMVEAEDVPQISLDSEELTALSDDPDMQQSEEAGQNIDVSLSKSQQETSQDEGRKSDMMSWQIGAEAAKMLAQEPKKWGNPNNNKMIWTDTKSFYGQYLQRKYENIKEYLKQYTKEDVLAIVVSRLQGKNQDISDTKYQQNIRSIQQEAAAKVAQNQKDSSAALSQYSGSMKSTLDSLEKQREALVAKMDSVNAKISASSNEISDMRAVTQDTALQELDSKVNAKVVYPDAGSTVIPTSNEKIIGTDALNKAAKSNITDNTDDSKIKTLNSSISSNKKILSKYEDELASLDDKIAEAKLAMQESAANSMDKKADEVEKIKANVATAVAESSEDYAKDVKKNLKATLKEKAEDNPAIDPLITLMSAEAAAKRSLNALYEQVDIVVDDSYNKLMAMGDSLYLPSSHSKVVAIHNEMISKLKALTLAYSLSGIIEIKNVAVYAKLLATDSGTESEGFFVGATPKARDMKAPYAIPDYSLPPVREVFHFDSTDFGGIKPTGKGLEKRSITAAEFLNYGGEVPQIWQDMLKQNAFIETDFKLKDALDIGCHDEAFSRGGIMPCVVDGYREVLDINTSGNYRSRKDLSKSSLPRCIQVKAKNGKLYHSMYDSKVDLGLNTSGVEKPGCEYSELGMILEADKKNNLKIRKRLYNTYSDLLANEDSAKLTNAKKNKISLGNHASISRNQIGDFLRHVENEKLQKENLEEYQQRYDKDMENLVASLEEYGFSPTKDFDLRNESDYNLAVNKLKEIEKQKIASAAEVISATEEETEDNAPVEEKINNLKTLIYVMEQDKNYVMKVSSVTADIEDINAEIKKAEADNAAVDKYKNSLKEQEGDYTDPTEPYCANYW